MSSSNKSDNNIINNDSECPICYDPLNMNTIVNSLCGHSFCNVCFWKSAESSNKCPLCRQDLIPRDRDQELEMRNSLFEAYDNLDDLYEEASYMRSKCNEWEKKCNESEQKCIQQEELHKELVKVTEKVQEELIHKAASLYQLGEGQDFERDIGLDMRNFPTSNNISYLLIHTNTNTIGIKLGSTTQERCILQMQKLGRFARANKHCYRDPPLFT